MMKVAVAGTNGFAQYIALCLQDKTSCQFMVLSRGANPGLERKGWQVVPTDYRNSERLDYLLTGVDVVISTIGGEAQLALINAAARVRVGRFVPSEFCGLPDIPPFDGPIATARRDALDLLEQLKPSGMRSTCFFFGVFYERFVAGKLAESQISINKPLGVEAFLVDAAQGTGAFPLRLYNYSERTPRNRVCVSMVSARDAARFVVEMLDTLPQSRWPPYFRFCAQTLDVLQILNVFELVTHQQFQYTLVPGGVNDYLQALSNARAANNTRQIERYSQLLTAAQGGFDLGEISVYGRNFECQDFQTWLRGALVSSSPI